jgi:flagellar protein FliO/FliZ
MQAVTFFFAFVAVLALIGVAAWLVRRFASNRLGANTNRGRMPRLAVIDAAAVDGRRRLVLVRRDNIEHLLMIGGPTDIVVEANIVRASAQREALPARPSAAAEPPPPPPPASRVSPLPDAASWLDVDGGRGNGFDHHHEPQMPEPPPRPARPSFADEVRRVPPAAAERRSDPLAGFAAEALSPRPEPRLQPRSEPRIPEPRIEPRPDPRPEPRAEPRIEPRAEPTSEPRHELRGEPMPPRMPRGEPMMPRPSRLAESAKAPPARAPERPIAPPPPLPAANADQNLAEMAQRLEAALRRPGGDAAPPVAPEAPPLPGRAAQRSEPPAAPPAALPKSTFENLEDEMASLLGRPKSSSSS